MNFDNHFGLRFIPKNPKIGLVIGTYGGIPYIDLFLKIAQRLFPHIPVLVHDDSSTEPLESLVSQYSQEFITTNSRQGHGPGDVCVFVSGLKWAKDNKFDILVKMSRRFIPLFDWTISFKALAYQTQFFTYSNECKYFHFPIRSECLGMHVNSWYNCNLQALVIPNVDVEYNLHVFVKKLQELNCSPINKNYVYRNQKLNLPIDFGIWDEIGNNRMLKISNILWHDNCGEIDYYILAKEYGLNYTLDDFKL